MQFEEKEEGGFKYIEYGEGEVLMLLHGLFGALSNFKHILEKFSKRYKVVIPLLPIFELPVLNSTVKGLVKHVEKFVEHKKFNNMIILGNSLGGHVAQLYTLANQDKVRALILTGSSGLYENTFGGSFPKRGNYEFIKHKTELTFYKPETASKELVDEVFEICNNNAKAIRVLNMARSAIKENLAKDVPNIHQPTLLIWGKQDTITPPEVATEFNRLIPNSTLKWVDECGHAPMMEKPEEFNNYLDEFLTNLNNAA